MVTSLLGSPKQVIKLFFSLRKYPALNNSIVAIQSKEERETKLMRYAAMKGKFVTLLSQTNPRHIARTLKYSYIRFFNEAIVNLRSSIKKNSKKSK